MPSRKSIKRDNAKRPIGPASGHPGSEGDRSDKASRKPASPAGTHVENLIPNPPQTEQPDFGGHRGQRHSGTLYPNQGKGGRKRR